MYLANTQQQTPLPDMTFLSSFQTLFLGRFLSKSLRSVQKHMATFCRAAQLNQAKQPLTIKQQQLMAQLQMASAWRDLQKIPLMMTWDLQIQARNWRWKFG